MSDAAAKRRTKKERSREAKAARRAAEARRRRIRRFRRWGLTALAAIVLLGGAGAVYLVTSADRRAAEDRLGDLVTVEHDLGRTHVASTTNDPAPTSGPHSGAPVCGVVSRPVPVDAQIHALEHGAVAYQYRDADVGADGVAALADLAEDLGSLVLVAPNPQLDAPVVATAWNRKMRVDEVDVDRLRDFATAFRGRGPEDVPCPL